MGALSVSRVLAGEKDLGRCLLRQGHDARCAKSKWISHRPHLAFQIRSQKPTCPPISNAIRKIPAGTGRLELSLRNIPGVIHMQRGH